MCSSGAIALSKAWANSAMKSEGYPSTEDGGGVAGVGVGVGVGVGDVDGVPEDAYVVRTNEGAA